MEILNALTEEISLIEDWSMVNSKELSKLDITIFS